MKKMLLLIFFNLFIMLPFSVKAATEYGYSNVTGGSFGVRSSASSSASIIGNLYGGVNVEIVGTASGNGCGTWYKINYNNGTGWVCGISTGGSRNIEKYTTNTLRTNDRTATTDCEKEMSNAGFPASYWDKLCALKAKHSNWNFVANKTNRDFSYVIYAETGAVSDGDIDKSLLYAYNNDTDLIAGYLKTDSYNYKTNKFIMRDSGYFYAARQEVVAYYMDPRNFLNENFIIQFETLSYNSAYQTESIVKNIFGSGYLNKYASNYVNAGKTNNISPVHMAARSVQEGLNKSNFLTTGSSFTYSANYYKANTNIYGKTFSNCFNFFNIGAYSDSVSAAQNAGIFACDPFNNKTYKRPWNSVNTALDGGAYYLAEDYINRGQDTLYFQKWNVSSYTPSNTLYAHQYMSNITAPAYEGSDTYDSYNAYGIINNAAFTFIIPVYNNMPEKTSLPSSLSPNNYLSSLKVNGTSVSGFDGDKTEGYSINVSNDKTTVSITTTTVVSSAKVTINNGNSISLKVGDNKIPVLVTAANGEKRTYYVNVIRDASSSTSTEIDKVLTSASFKVDSTYLGGININNKVSEVETKIKNQNNSSTISITDKNNNTKSSSSIMATGDKITIKIGDDTKTYTVYVYGDVNGDGKVSSADYLMIRDYIMGTYKLEGAYKLGSDVTKDGNVKSGDYLKIRDYIMGKISSL